MLLADMLKIKKGATAIIGGGGKTTMMYTLARELEKRGSVIVTTTTHIFAPEHMPLLLDPNENEVRSAVQKGQAVCVGGSFAGKKLCPSVLAVETLCQIAEYVIIEADGSRSMPLKAHAAHEPALPQCSGDVILLMGMSALGKSVKDSVHRAAIFCSICGCAENAAVTPALAARLANAEALHTKAFLNQTDAAAADAVLELARLINSPVYSGALQKGEWKCLCL